MHQQLQAKRFSSYAIWSIDNAAEVCEFPGCEKEYVVATVGPNSYIYYKRFEGVKFHRLREEELSFMSLAGEEIPF